MEKAFHSKEEIMKEIIEAQNELFEILYKTEQIFFDKSHLEKLRILNDMYQNFESENN